MGICHRNSWEEKYKYLYNPIYIELYIYDIMT
jgi:hypothetical protein